MKLFVVTALFAAIIAGTCAFTSKQAAKGESLAKECIKETGCPPAVVNRLKNGDFSDTHEQAKCFTKCFFEKAGFLDENGELKIEEIVAKLIEDEPEETVRGLLDTCKGSEGATLCETTWNIYKCYRENTLV